MRLAAIAFLWMSVVSVGLVRADFVFEARSICTFAVPGSQIGYGTGLVAVGDFNVDGVWDFAILDPYQNRVRTFLQSGAEWEEQATDLGIGGLPVSFDCADFNEDGVPDLAIACRYPGAIKVLLGDGVGQFDQSFSLAVGSPIGVQAGQLNDAEGLDLAIVDDAESTVLIATGHRDGTYSLDGGVIIEIDDTLETVTVGDLNGDGRDDLVVPCPLQDSVAIVTNMGGGDYSVEVHPVGDSPLAACVFQADGDPDLEIAVTNRGSAEVTFIHGDDAESVSMGMTPWGVAASDFDGDGLEDVAVARAQLGGVGLLRRDSSGSFQPSESFALAGSARSIQSVRSGIGQLPGLVVLSVDEDQEIAFVFYLENLSPTPIRVLRGDANSSGNIDIADLVELISVLTGSGSPQCGDACDVNDDGYLNVVDLVVVLRMLTSSGAQLPLECEIDSSPDAWSCIDSTCP